jgi:hypothetical protein
MRRRSRTSTAAAVLLALLAALLPTPRSPAAAQTPSGVLSLRGQTNWWLPEQPFTIELAVQSTAAAGDLEVAVDLFGQIRTRSAFATTVERGVSGRPATEIPPVPLADLPTDDTGDRIVTFTPPARTEGVYPLRVQLRPLGGGNPVDSFVTFLVHVPTVLEGDPLSVGLVLPVHAPPAVQPTGDVAIDDERAEELAELAVTLEDHADVGLTLAPTPETVEALAGSPRNQDRQTMATFAGALGNRELLGGPWVPTNLTAILEGGLEETSAGLLTRGTQALRTQFSGAEPVTSTRVVDERLTDASLAFLQAQQQVSRLVVPESLLEPVRQNKTLARQFTLESRRGPVQAVGVDAALAAHFTGRDAVLGAHRLLADLAVIYNDDPEIARRGVAVSPPRSWVPDATFTDVLLDGLATSPLLRGVSLDRFFTDVDVATTGTGSRVAPLVRRPVVDAAAASDGGALPSASIRAARSRIEQFASAVDATDAAGAAILDRLDRTLLATVSSDLRSRDRIRYVSGVNDQISEQILGIAMPQNRSITLTAREGEIPVTVRSNLGYPMRAVLRVLSDNRVEFPEGSTHELDLRSGRNATSQFAVRAQSSGSFPVRVRVETPDGLVLAESRLTVRSTAISGVGTALSIGALVFLLVWWANHLRGRRSRRLVPT